MTNVRVWLVVAGEFVRFSAICAVVLYLVVGAGQTVQLVRIVGGVGHVQAWAAVLGHAAVILSEVILPLAMLFAATLVLGRLRSQGAAIGLSCSGARPTTLLVPIGVIALGAALVGACLAHYVVPHSVGALGQLATQAAADRLLDDTLARGPVTVSREDRSDGRPVHWATIDRPGEPAILLRGEAFGCPCLGFVRRGEALGASCRRGSRRGEALGKPFVCPRRGFMHVFAIIFVLRGLKGRGAVDAVAWRYCRAPVNNIIFCQT